MNARCPAPHHLIRQIDSGRYLSPSGDWVWSEEEAFDFPDLRSALTTCEKMAASRVEMIMVFDREASSRTSRLIH